MNTIVERRDGEDRRVTGSALSFFGNGKAEWLRWLVSMLVAALVAYGTVNARISALEATAEARHDELKRFMQRVDSYMERNR